LERRANCVERVVEHGMNAVARHLDDDTAIGLHRLARHRVVACQCLAHPLGFLLPEPGTAFDIGEKKRGKRALIVHAENA
jgi:hypothetical protein